MGVGEGRPQVAATCSVIVVAATPAARPHAHPTPSLGLSLIPVFYGFTGITIQKIEDDPESLVGVTAEELANRE